MTKPPNFFTSRSGKFRLFVTVTLIGLSCFTRVNGQTTERSNLRNDPSGKSFSFRFTEGDRPAKGLALGVVRTRLRLPAEIQTLQLSAHKDKWGTAHERYAVRYKGIPVEHASIHLHFKADKLTSANGGNLDITLAETVPAISGEEAVKKGIAFINAKKYFWEFPEAEKKLKETKKDAEATWFPDPQLVIYQNVLAYKLHIYAAEPMSRDWVYVDAKEGTILDRISQIKHNNTPGTAATRLSGTQTIMTYQDPGNQYMLRDYTRGQGVFTYNLNKGTNTLNATDFIDNDNNWSAAEYNNADKDNAALDIHWGLQMAYDYWSNIHQRNSYDGMGGPITGYAHYDVNELNAFSAANGEHYFGDGWQGYETVTELGIIGHEFGHTLIDFASQLNYSTANETAIIHEGLSDIWGACLENYVNTNPQITLNPLKNVWVSASEIGLYNPLMRNLSDPNLSSGADTYMGTLWDFENAHYHNNGLVIGHWFYILSEGKTGVNDHGVSFNVQGIAISNAEQIAYAAVNDYLQPDASISDLKIATLLATADIFGAASPEYQAVLEAWKAVGVPDPLPAYCTAIQQPAAGQLSITLVQIIKKLFVLGEPGNNYGYNLDDTKMDFLQGTTYPIQLSSAGGSEIVSQYAKVWADFNRDGSFDGANELLFQADNVGDPVTGNISIPSGITYGTTRLRVMMSNSPIPSSCTDIYPNGEVKDFMIRILPEITGITHDGYCAPVGSDSNSELVGFCKLGTLDGYTGWYPQSIGFADLAVPSGFSYKLWRGETYPLKLGPKYLAGSQPEEYFTIWIDYDQNKTFDPSELIFQGHTNTFLTSLITIPSNAVLGFTRMRIAMSRNAYASSSCMPVEYGEFMDYKINIQPAQTLSGGYCSPRGHCYRGDYTAPYDFGIDSVSISMNHLKNYLGDSEGYVDYTLSNNNNIGPIQVHTGNSYPLRLRAKNAETMEPVYWKVWVDYNHDFVFSQSEVIVEGLGTQGVLHSTITIPPGSLTGNTRMRVATSFFSPQPDPCGIINYGQMIDILLNVQSLCDAPSAPYISNVSAFSAVLFWTPAPGSGNTYEVYYRKVNTPGWFTDTTPIQGITLQNLIAGTAYEFKVRTLCPNNQFSAFTSLVPFTTTCLIPFGLKATDISMTQAKLSWTTVSGDAGGYDLHYKKTNESIWTILPNVTSPQTLPTLTAATSYQFRVKTKCASTDSFFSQILSFNTNCNSKGTSTNFEYITRVALANVVNNTGSNGGYLNYTNNTIQLTQATSYVLTVRGFIAAAHTDYFLAWIDFNSDGFFDFSERIAYLTANVSQQSYNAAFTVPANAVTGLKQMRVSMKNPTAPGACETFFAGEVEDYRVNITASPSMARIKQDAQEQENNIEVENAEIVLYPNPVKDVLNITSVSDDLLVIMDALGREVYSGQGTDQINVALWTSGVYFMRIRNKTGTRTSRFVKE